MSKTVNGVKYTYAYINGLLMYETRGNAKFYYSYDANGTLYSVKYTLTDSSDLMTYYFTHNSRGDIVGIYNGAGQLRAHYEYDAWGNTLSVTDQNGNAITSATHIGNLNPFRYRGYYLDTETGLYYLMSRYYRFVNADGYFQSGGDVLDANMCSYCGNNPISFVGPTGCCYWAAGKWRHDSWEYKGNYKRKPAPGTINSDLTPIVIDGTNTGASILTDALTNSAKSYVSNAARPVNIGAGSYGKSLASQLNKIDKFSSGATKVFKGIGNFTSAASVALDVGTGIYDNIQAGSSWDKIACDASVDLFISGGSVLSAGAAGSAIGTFVGSICPGLGNIVGAGAGFFIGVGFYIFTDVIPYNGKTARAWAKEGINSLW